MKENLIFQEKNEKLDKELTRTTNELTKTIKKLTRTTNDVMQLRVEAHEMKEEMPKTVKEEISRAKQIDGNFLALMKKRNKSVLE